MSLNIGDNFSYLGKKFLDNRQSFDTLELMNNCSDVPIGFITFCKEDNKRYEYTESGWVEYSTSISNEQVEKINAAYNHSQTQHVQPSDLEGFATEEFVTNKIAEAELGGEKVDLSGYVSKEELEGKGYLTGIPEEYVTDEELNAKGYLTEHQDLSGYATKEYVDEAISNIDISGGNIDVDLSDYVTNAKLQEGLANKFDNVEVNEAETNDAQTALDFYANGEVVKTVYFSGGGGGSANIPPYISTILPENSILGLGEIFDLQLDFSSSVTGRGTVKIFVNDVESISMSIPQGENTIPMADTYFTKGNNRVTVYVIDRTGQMSNSLTFYVRYGSLEIVSDFDAYTAYEPGAVVRYYFTPTAVDTSLALTMYMKIDGEVKDGVSCSSDTRGYFTFPNNLEVGAHYCQAYVADSAGSTSNVLTFNFIVLDNVSLVVASDTINPIVEEGEQLSLDYKVYMRGSTSFITKTYIDENLVNTGTCGLDFAYYRTNTLTEGIHTIKMEVYDVTETVSDYIIWTVTVTPSTYEMLQPVKAGSLFIGTAQNMTNSSENKEVWRGTDQDGAIVDGILHNFAFNSESGWVDDELLISGASSVEIPITPLANNARYGFTLDIEFASKMIGVDDALVLNLWDDEKDCGIKITTEQVILRSAEGNQADLYFTDSEMTSVMFVIDRNEATAKIYLNGVMCSAFHLSDYSIDGVPYLEDFTVNNTIMLGGSGYARIKNLRVYQVALSTDEILNNFMANETRKAEQKALVEFQKGDHLPTLTIYCDFSGLGKDDKKPCAITYVSTDEEKYGKSFTLTHKKSTCQYQGTSSMAYPIKNYRINLADETGEKWKYDFPYGKPERRFTLKADFMSSGHWTNTGLTKWINNNLYNYDLDDEKTMNPKKWYDINNGGSIDDTRECIYGFPCRLILVNDGKTPLNEGQNEPTPGNTKDMGIFNFNHDKDATDTMGFDDDVFPYCASYEVTANSDTSAGAFMKYDANRTPDMTELDYIKQSFELRFPDEDDVPEGWGFMGVKISKEQRIIMVPRWGDNHNYVCGVPTEYFGTSITNNSGLSLMYFRFHDASGEEILMYTLGPDETVNIPENAVTFSFHASNNINSYTFNDHIVMVEGSGTDKEWSGLAYSGHQVKTTIVDGGYENGTGLKALIDWVDGCTDEEFVRDFDQHFNRDYTLRYFLLVITLGMVDNLGKNMMLDTWDNKIYMPRFYDCDTICSYDNSGQLKFDVDIEMTQGYWNTSSSRLWTRIRDLMHDELVAKYNNMRQNGLSYESLMECFYDEQIAKIPQRYYNMDYDVKYGPFAYSYIGMANGDVYEHVKRWLQQRLRFVDTLYDYAPSYNNDVLTIRANTTEPMTLEIETYTPVYQHLSWYNNQMDKKKIDGKTSVTFTGTAMAATDQEVLIYGGSNIKSIKGISSMNPNRMLIGSATRLIELDAPNCPLLADINANKANLAPHIYLNKVNLSGCPLLGGNLIVNQSPLVREIDIRGTSITGLNLPPSLRNLETLKLPAAINELNLNDGGQLHTIEFEEGAKVDKVKMTNCNALVNVTNFNLEDATSITLNNSYSTVNDLYFSKATNLSVSNMSNLERIIYTPNAEHEVFDKANVDNAPTYTISTFNCPKLKEFITTAPYRNSYGKDYGEKKPNEVFEANILDISSTQFKDVKLLCTTDTNKLLLPRTIKNLIVDSAYDLDTEYLTDGDYDTVHGELIEPYTTDYEGEVYKNIVPSASDGSLIFSMYAPHNTTEPASGTWDLNGLEFDNFYTYGMNNDVEQLYGDVNKTKVYHGSDLEWTASGVTGTTNIIVPGEAATIRADKTITNIEFYTVDGTFISNMTAIQPNDMMVTPSDAHSFKITPYLSDCSSITITITYIGYDVTGITMPKRDANYKVTIENANVKPKELPTMLYPKFINTDSPIKGVVDYSEYEGTSLDWIAAYMNKDEVDLTITDEIILNSTSQYNISKDSEYVLRDPRAIAIYTCNTSNVLPTFNNGFTGYSVFETTNEDNTYTTTIISDNLNNLPTSITFSGVSSLLSVEHLNVNKVTNMQGMFYNCTSLTSVDTSNWDTSNVINMQAMFQNCRSLTSLDTSNWNTRNVTITSNMLQNCSKLESFDLSNKDCSKVTSTSNMFANCSNIRTIDLKNTNMSLDILTSMFSSCSNLEEIKCDGWINESMRNRVIQYYQADNLIYGCNKLKTDIFMYLCGIYRMVLYTNTDATEPRILDFSGIDTSAMTNMNVYGNTTSIINLHSENGLNLSLRDAKSLTHVDSLHFKWNQLGFRYYYGGGSTLDIIFETTENSTNYKYENWKPGDPNSVLRLGDTRFTVVSIVSFLECLYDYTSKGERTNATLQLGSNLNRLTPEQIAIATNKGWTLT